MAARISLEDNFPDENLTLKFRLTDAEIIAIVYINKLNIIDVKKDLGDKFKVNYNNLSIFDDNDSLTNDTRLYDLCKNDYGIIDLNLHIEGDEKLDIDKYYSNFTLPDIITVVVPIDERGDSGTKEIIVEIENKSIVKPFLGGFKDKETEIEYLDAFSQTGPALGSIKYEGTGSRQTQTVDSRNTCDDTHYDRCTQAYGEATKIIYISDVTDYTISPKPYETYDAMTMRINKIGKIILIQRNYRRYRWQKLIKEAAAEWRLLYGEQKRREAKIEENYINRYKNDCIAKTFPRTKEDFDLLLAQVQKWKESEREKISALHSGGPKIAELNCLLEKEVQLLNVIEKQRMAVQKELKQKHTEKILKNLGTPVKWVGYRHIVVEMDLLRTQRVRKLTNYYNCLKANKFNDKTERLKLMEEILDLLKNEENCVIFELEELFNREKILLLINIGDDNLDKLRERQLVIFFDIIRDEENYKPKRSESKVCEKCNTVRPISELALHTRQIEVNVCKFCTNLKIPPIDKSIYRSILRTIRRDERKRGALASYAFVVQDEDIRHIIENLWHGHSALSQCDVRTDLRLPRWNIGDDWSPWNCICLTGSEARAHVKILNLQKVYDKKFIDSIIAKNLLAKSVFKKLKEVDHDYVESGQWWKVGLDGKTV